MSSRLRTRRSRRSASSQIVSSSSRRWPSSIAALSSRSVVAAPVIAASGVRRSWDRALSSELRRSSVFTRRDRPLISRLTASMIRKVRTCFSATTNVKAGGMKKKSNASTDSVAASSDGPRPKRAAAITTTSR